MYFRSAESRPAVVRRTSIFRRALCYVLALSAIVTVILTAAAFFVVRGIVMQQSLARVASIAASAEDGIEQAVNEARTQASLLTAYPDVRDILAGNATPARFEALLASLKADRPSVTGLLLVTPDGRAVASAGDAAAIGIRQTSVTSVVGKRGWEAFEVTVPVRGESGLLGWLVVRHEVAALQRKIASPLPSLGETAVVLLGVVRDNELVLLVPEENGDPAHALVIGDIGEQRQFKLPLAFAAEGMEGGGIAEDHRGRQVVTAYRSLPYLDVGLAVQVDKADVMQSVRELAATLLSLGILLFALAVLIALLFARSLTRPLAALSDKVSKLGPGSWDYDAGIRSGDEVQVLDFVVADMAFRLKSVYQDLEREIKARTKQLQEQYAFDRTILDSIQHGVVAVDAHGKISAVNPAAERIAGIPHDKLLDARAEDVLPIRKGDAVLSPHPLAVCLKKRKPFRPEPGEKLNFAAADGSIIPVMVLASPLLDGRKLFGAVMVFQDVRDERLMDDLKSEFVTLASHQLRTPLSIIRWQMDILRGEKGLSEGQKASVTEMESALARMTDLLNALLKVSQLESGALAPQLAPMDVCSIAQDVTSELKLLAEQHKVRFSLACPAKPLRIASDSSLLRIVLHNLLTNAVKYTRPDTDVDVSVEQYNGGVKISVTDRGLGVPVSEQRLLFTKFFRGRNIRTVDTDGNGLGLYIIKMIVEELGGTIHFTSEEGKGTTFVVMLPGKKKAKKS